MKPELKVANPRSTHMQTSRDCQESSLKHFLLEIRFPFLLQAIQARDHQRGSAACKRSSGGPAEERRVPQLQPPNGACKPSQKNAGFPAPHGTPKQMPERRFRNATRERFADASWTLTDVSAMTLGTSFPLQTPNSLNEDPSAAYSGTRTPHSEACEMKEASWLTLLVVAMYELPQCNTTATRFLKRIFKLTRLAMPSDYKRATFQEASKITRCYEKKKAWATNMCSYRPTNI